MKTRGSLVAVWGHNGTVVAVYASKGSPCIHAHSCLQYYKTNEGFSVP